MQNYIQLQQLNHNHPLLFWLKPHSIATELEAYTAKLPAFLKRSNALDN